MPLKLLTKTQVKTSLDIEKENQIQRGLKIAKKLDELTEKYRQKEKEYNQMIALKEAQMNKRIFELQDEITVLENKKNQLTKNNA